MNVDLIVCVRAEREQFIIREYVGEDDLLVLVASGSFVFDDGSGERTAKALDAVIFEKGKTYHRTALEPLVMYLFRYKAKGKLFGETLLHFEDRERTAATVRLLGKLDENVYLDDFEERKGLFEDLLRQYRIESGDRIGSDRPHDKTILHAMSLLTSELHYRHPLPMLAQEAGLSYAQFSRRFRQEAGMTPFEYLAQVRMKKARQLLADTDLPISDIAVACGFDNEYYFSNFFKKYHQLPPSAFRRAAR